MAGPLGKVYRFILLFYEFYIVSSDIGFCYTNKLDLEYSDKSYDRSHSQMVAQPSYMIFEIL